MKKELLVLLITIVCFIGITSCSSDTGEFHLYSFKEIRYSIEDGDGLECYKTPMGIIVKVNNSTTEDCPSPQSDAFVNNHERYVFSSDNLSLFSMVDEPVYVPIPFAIRGTHISLTEEKKPFSTIEIDESKKMELLPSFTVPPMTNMTLTGELTIEKLTVTYEAVFIEHPSNKAVNIRGKYIRYYPQGIEITPHFEKL